MKISGFTFIRNGDILGYPYVESIKSILPIVDEFIVNIGPSDDETLQNIRKINNPKIKIIESDWAEKMQNKGFVYGQQKMISQFNCTGDWAFYVEGDEIYHEDDLEKLKKAMSLYESDEKVEAIAVNFFHFYGNQNSYLDSPGWYRSEARIIKTSVRSYAPDGLFWLVLEKNKIGRYPRAKKINVCCYHYGWVRTEEEMNLKSKKVQKFWSKKYNKIKYSEMDQKIIKPFLGTHPKIIQGWLPRSKSLFMADPNYRLTRKQKKHRLMLIIEKMFNVDLSKKHYKKI